MNSFDALLQTLLTNALPVLLAITLHEAAHGYVARYFGDPTAEEMGRVSLNPARHLDLMGTIIMPAVLYLATSGAFVMGYAKPVPVNFSRLRNPKRDMVWVALAGPASNLIQAFLWAIFLVILAALKVNERFFVDMSQAGVSWNLVMCAFNLFPLPPLDGGRILVGLLPPKPAAALARIEPWGFFIVVGLVVAGVVDRYWLQPLMRLGYALINTLILTPAANYLN